ncbi:MAG TPA: hypothetical protein VEZ16_00465 [Microvirga sp.]|nr:hypothetical protein [Microvirga sp.]
MSPGLLIAVLAITVGLPFLLFFAMVASQGVDPNIIGTILGGAVLTTFMILMIFEIRRLAELS